MQTSEGCIWSIDRGPDLWVLVTISPGVDGPAPRASVLVAVSQVPVSRSSRSLVSSRDVESWIALVDRLAPATRRDGGATADQL